MEHRDLLQRTQCKTFVHTGANCVRLVKIGGKTKEMSDQGASNPISVTLTRVRNEKIACHRFGWMVFQCVQCFDPNIKRTNRKTFVFAIKNNRR